MANVVKCFTDGACSCNPGPGGFGIVFLNSKDEFSSGFYGGYDYTTNNRMELIAVLEAIKLAKKNEIEQLIVCSDSAYVVNAVTGGWIDKWLKNNWINSKNQLVKNKDLWLKYLKLTEGFNIAFEKVSGHAGIKFNEMADSFAVQGSKDVAEEIIRNGDVHRVSKPKD